MFSVIESSAIKSITYYNGQIVVTYIGGGVYSYPATPDEAFVILSATSKGKAVNQVLKDGREFEKVLTV